MPEVSFFLNGRLKLFGNMALQKQDKLWGDSQYF